MATIQRVRVEGTSYERGLRYGTQARPRVFARGGSGAQRTLEAVGHGGRFQTFPVGVAAELDADAATLRLLDPPLS